MRRLGVVVPAPGVGGVLARHFLQKHHIRAHLAHRLAQFMEHEFAVEHSKAFVDVHGQDLERKI